MLQDSNISSPGESDVTSSDVTSLDATSKPFHKFIWFKAAIDLAKVKDGQHELSHAEFRVLAVAWDHSNRHGRRIFPSNKGYEDRANVSKNTRDKALKRLCKLGYLILVKQGGTPKGGGDGNTTNHYRLNPRLPQIAAEATSQ